MGNLEFESIAAFVEGARFRAGPIGDLARALDSAEAALRHALAAHHYRPSSHTRVLVRQATSTLAGLSSIARQEPGLTITDSDRPSTTKGTDS